MIVGANSILKNLIFSYDAGNGKSFKGEPTSNLLFNNGVIDFSLGNLDATVSKTTIVANDRYRIKVTNQFEGIKSFRLYVPLANLINGLTYNLSYKYRFIKEGWFRISDWCDTPISNRVEIDYGDYLYASGCGTKASYSSVYRFFDFAVSVGVEVEIWDIQVEQKNHATPFTNGVRTSNNLVDLTGNIIMENVNATYDDAGRLTFDGIDDYINLGNNPLLQMTGDQTLEFVVYPTNNTGRRNWWGKAYGGEGAITYEPGGNLNYYYGSGSGNTTPYASIGTSNTPLATLNRYYHVVLVRDLETLLDGTIAIYWYINGVLNRKQNTGLIPVATVSPLAMSIGKGYAGVFAGEVPVIRMYNKALTVEQVKLNFISLKTRFGL